MTLYTVVIQRTVECSVQVNAETYDEARIRATDMANMMTLDEFYDTGIPDDIRACEP